jgi:predicted nucleic acid-binding protein
MAAALLDSNVLIQAAYKRAPFHTQAAALVAQGLRRGKRFCLAPQNLIEFAAVVTRKRFVDPPMAPAEVQRITDMLYRSRRLAKIYPQRGTVRRALAEGATLGIQGPRWYDLFLAVTMRDAAVEIVITENTTDFAHIPFVRALTIDAAFQSFDDT